MGLTVNGDNRADGSDFAYTVEDPTDGNKGSIVSTPYSQSAALILELKSASSVSNSIEDYVNVSDHLMRTLRIAAGGGHPHHRRLLGVCKARLGRAPFLY